MKTHGTLLRTAQEQESVRGGTVSEMIAQNRQNECLDNPWALWQPLRLIQEMQTKLNARATRGQVTKTPKPNNGQIRIQLCRERRANDSLGSM